ncbi:hypothetical protein AGMMS4956_11430 [Bacteroidia bacterium]|nr:hypothetical protein AGMMS4956_11430 [Bacteroidia bacterium]
MIAKNELSALINLLDDPDPEVIKTVQERVLAQGEDVLPALQQALLSGMEGVRKQRVQGFIEQVQQATVQKEFTEWVANNGKNMLRGMYCIAKFACPEVRYDDVHTCFKTTVLDLILPKIKEKQTLVKKIQIVNDVLFNQCKFVHLPYSNEAGKYYIHQLLKEKQLTPISLIMLYLCIAERLHISMEVVFLPRGWALLCRTDAGKPDFYINPFLKGNIFGDSKNSYLADNFPLNSIEEFTNMDYPDMALLLTFVRTIQECYNMSKDDKETQKHYFIKTMNFPVQVLAEKVGMEMSPM